MWFPVSWKKHTYSFKPWPISSALIFHLNFFGISVIPENKESARIQTWNCCPHKPKVKMLVLTNANNCEAVSVDTESLQKPSRYFAKIFILRACSCVSRCMYMWMNDKKKKVKLNLGLPDSLQPFWSKALFLTFFSFYKLDSFLIQNTPIIVSSTSTFHSSFPSPLPSGSLSLCVSLGK